MSMVRITQGLISGYDGGGLTRDDSQISNDCIPPIQG